MLFDFVEDASVHGVVFLGWGRQSPCLFVEHSFDRKLGLVVMLEGQFNLSVLGVHFDKIIFAEEPALLHPLRFTVIDTSCICSPLIKKECWVLERKSSRCEVTSSINSTTFKSLTVWMGTLESARLLGNVRWFLRLRCWRSGQLRCSMDCSASIIKQFIIAP